MSALIHLIYCSAATRPMNESELRKLLVKARAKNARLGITGILLYENGSFFQVLEGVPEVIDRLFNEICQDNRHNKVSTIIRESIFKRAFSEWTMGYPNVSLQELDEIIGLNDFFAEGSSLTEITPGRAKKILAAFRDGRWRAKVRYTSSPEPEAHTKQLVMQPATMVTPKVSFAFQPMINAVAGTVGAYEAILRGQHDEAFPDIAQQIGDAEWSYFDTNCRAIAISMAAKLGLPCDLHLSFVARRVEDAREAISASLDAAEKNNIEPSRIILQIDQDRLIGERDHFAQIIEEYRGAGLRISIDHFGSGQASFNLLELLRPEMISLNAQLVRDINNSGPRQAIVLGLKQTCTDLGIDLVAKHIETVAELGWFVSEGIELLQGNVIASPAFERLPSISWPLV